ncbi:MAG TPA: GNAT family N-acetyltransferase [Anaerolineae bacterium]|nr:GNAT family N-acetyltransferase [Anaerolineae bacterium]
MTIQSAAIAQSNTPGHLRKMGLGEFERFIELIETAFAEDQAREGRSFRDEIRSLDKLLPLFKVMFAVAPPLEDYFCTYVWEVDGHFASAVTVRRQGSDALRWYIANVATHPDCRGRGLARTLVSAALDRIRARGGRYAFLDVRADNEPAYRLYRSLGFLQLETSTTFKGDTHPMALPALPGDYALRPLAAMEWRTRLTVAQYLASPETRSVCPPTAKQFQPGWIGRSLQALIDRAQHIQEQTGAIAAYTQPIGLVTCRAQRSGRNPHQVQIALAPEHVITAAAAIAQAINYCVGQRSGAAHPMLIKLAGLSSAVAEQLRVNGFTPIETVHELGMKVS